MVCNLVYYLISEFSLCMFLLIRLQLSYTENNSLAVKNPLNFYIWTFESQSSKIDVAGYCFEMISSHASMLRGTWSMTLYAKTE